MTLFSHLLGDILVGMDAITRQQLDDALNEQVSFMDHNDLYTVTDRPGLVTGVRSIGKQTMLLGQILINKGYITMEQLQPALDIQAKRAKNLSRLDSEKLSMALELGFIINSTLNLVDVLSLIMKYACLVTDAEASTLMLLDEKTGELVFSVPTGTRADRLEDIRIAPGTGIAGWVALNEEHVLVKDTSNDPRFYSEIDRITGSETRSLLCVPMRAKRKLIGVLEVINKGDIHGFTEQDALLLTIFAHQAAIAIDNATLVNSLKRMHQDEQTMKKQLAESEKASAMGNLASSIAHDFNNILSGIFGYSQLAKAHITNPERALADIDKIVNGAEKASALVNQILMYSRKADHAKQPVYITRVIREALELLRGTLPERIVIQEALLDDSVILADPTKLHQVVMNICTNAVHAMEETGGVLGIVAENLAAGDKVLIPELQKYTGQYLKLAISDTGTGIAPEILDRLFEPYFTTKKAGYGTGLGLAVVFGIVKEYNGHVSVTSELGKGTVFNLFFPVFTSC